MRRLRYLWLSIALTVVLVTPATVGLSQDTGRSSSGYCSTNDAVPIDIVLSVPDAAVYPGAMTSILATLSAQSDLDEVDIRIEGEGVSLLGETGRFVGSLGRGEKVEIEIPVSYGALDRSAIVVTASLRHAKTGETMARSEGVYALFRDGRSYTGRDGFVALEHASVRQDFEQGLLTREDYETRLKEALAPEGVFDQDVRVAPPLSSAAINLPPLQPRFDQNRMPVQMAPVNPAGTVTVQGTVLYTDENGNTHGAYGVTVEVWDEELLIDDFITAVAVGSDGQYNFVIDNDDGIGQNGRDIYVKFVTENEAIRVQDGGVYETQSSVHDDLSDGAVVTENFTFGNTGDGPAGSVCAGASYIAAYVKFELNGGAALPQMPVNWPGSGAFYNGSSVNIAQGDRWDWDVLHHEYGHYVMDYFNFENNPGGPHSSANCSADVRPTKDEGIRLAWGESWPTYFALSGQDVLNLASLGMPRVGDTNYQDTENQSINYSLENNPEGLGGDDNERSLMRIFWDLYDSAVDGNDQVSFDDKALFDVFDAAGPVTFSQGWAALRASGLIPNNQMDLAIGAMCSDYGVGPVPVSPAAGATVSPSNPNFSWTGAVGCGTVAAGDEWAVVFYNPTTYAKILTISGLGATNTALTLPQLQTLIAGSANHAVLWAVEGKSTASPSTGPYLGANNAIFVNQPPVANAGADVTAECTSPAGTQVMLNGTGSSDPDGDVLSYSWSPAELFDDPNSATPTGTFELGTVTVTLTVSDGLESDTDDVDVTIEDTTPPDVFCAADVTVECSAFCGVPADDPQLAAFFAGFSSSDICCEDLDVSLDNPACFPLGETTVTYLATDCSGNQASCTAKVTVVDTTPPEIHVELNRDVLWPPNHKLADITADVTVSDICCEVPTFVLTSITSDEPDDGKGDGKTVGDIQSAEYGTADTAFKLRSERLGGGDGRVYTIVYTAEDCSGNTADDTVYVRVPHDHSGWAFASSGFSADGLSFDSVQDRFVLVVPSKPAEYTTDASGNQTLVAPAFDATTLDPMRTYVGNLKDVALPVETLAIDNNADGLVDLALYYSTQAVNWIVAASTPTGDRIDKKEVSDGPIGLHYVSAEGVDYLIDNIFSLGEPVPLVPAIVIVRTDGTGPDQPPVDPPVEETAEPLMAKGLLPMYPNPFNPSLAIPFNLEASERVSVRIYDAAGKLVRNLADEVMPAGVSRLVWDGRDDAGTPAATGIYFVRFRAGSYESTKKAVMMK